MKRVLDSPEDPFTRKRKKEDGPESGLNEYSLRNHQQEMEVSKVSYPPVMSAPHPPPRFPPAHWQQRWIDDANTIIPLYGFTIGFPAFRSTAFVPGLRGTEFPEARNMIYPSSEEISVFRSYRDNAIYKKWLGIYLVGKYRDDPHLGYKDAEEWINEGRNYGLLFRYFNQNCFQMLNFFGLSIQSDEIGVRPAYFSEPIQAPQVWKNMIIILFTQAMIENHFWGNEPIIKFYWKSGPITTSQPTLNKLKFATTTFTWLQPTTNTDESIMTALNGYGYTKLLFPNNPHRNAVELTNRLHLASNTTYFDSYLIGPNLDGFQTWEDLVQFCLLVYASYREEVKTKLSPMRFNAEDGKIENIKKPDYPSIFEAMKGKNVFTRFKMHWQSTVAGDTWLDYYAAKFYHRPLPIEDWPLKGGGYNVGELVPGSLEGELWLFMQKYAPYRLHVPKIENFWTLDRRSDEWLQVFERQWDDYYKWCYQNVVAKMNNPKQYIEPGRQFKDKDGKLMTITVHGKEEPLINTYPDYGIMDKDAHQKSGSYWRWAVIALPITQFIYGQDFWPMVNGFIKEVFTQVINALADIAKFVVNIVWEGLVKPVIPQLPNLGYAALIAVSIGLLVVGGGSFVSEVGTKLAGG